MSIAEAWGRMPVEVLGTDVILTLRTYTVQLWTLEPDCCDMARAAMPLKMHHGMPR